jgi:elongation factor P
MASMLEAIEIKRKSYFEYEDAPYLCLDVEVSKPTARGGQTLVRIKMRNMVTQAVFDRTFGRREVQRACLAFVWAYQYTDASGYHFWTEDLRHHHARPTSSATTSSCWWTTR